MTLRSTPKLVIQLCSLASNMEYMQNKELSLIKYYKSIQHLDYNKIFLLVSFCSQKLGIYYFRQFENACHVQENCYETLGTKLVFTITSNNYVEVSVLKISEKTTRMLDYYIPTKKINNNVITKIMSKFVEGKESNYSELKDCLEGYVNE